MHIAEAELPCYLNFITTINPQRDKIEQIETFLQTEYIGGDYSFEYNYDSDNEDGEEVFKTNEDNDQESIAYSVTTAEKGWEEWVTMAEFIPGSVVYKTERPGRTCYLCIVPLSPRLDEV